MDCSIFEIEVMKFEFPQNVTSNCQTSPKASICRIFETLGLAESGLEAL